jgi:hypothetical protein
MKRQGAHHVHISLMPNFMIHRLFLSSILLSLTLYSVSAAQHSPGNQIDPTDINDTLLAPVVDREQRKALELTFEKVVFSGTWHNESLKTYAPVLFFYRDTAVLPIFRSIITDFPLHPYFRAMAIHALGETGDKTDLKLLFESFSDTNAVLREYTANAIGKIIDTSYYNRVKKLTAGEKNFYVKKTLESATKRDRHLNTLNNCNCGKTVLKKEHFFPDKEFLSETGLNVDLNTRAIRKLTIASKCLFPHQQYKANKQLYDLIEFPFISFGIKDSWGLHTGEDSGWLFPGLPIHSILDGTVVKVQRESSWGCLIIIESRLCDGNIVTHYYGHLSHRILVKPGDKVYCGEQIGEIAQHFTCNNGGYLAHLHLSIEKGSYENATIKGWSYSTENWYSPYSFIKEYSKRCKK